MIRRFRVENYKALRDVTLELTPIHVLIGPNDSGKTSLLEAIAALCRSVDHDPAQVFLGSWKGRELVWMQESDLDVLLAATGTEENDTFEYQLGCRFGVAGRDLQIVRERVSGADVPALHHSGRLSGSKVRLTVFDRAFAVSDSTKITREQWPDCARTIYSALKGVHYYRWVPRLLSLPVTPDSKRQFRMEPSGFGLALCLDDILSYDRDRFGRLEDRFRSVFPHVKSIKLQREPAFRAAVDDPEQIPQLEPTDGKGIYFELSSGGGSIPASQASDGMLLVLAYMTVLYLPQSHSPRLVLVEEPENGIHPRRSQEVLGILRELVQEQIYTQVLLTTHSPYALDLFQPQEVTLCRRNPDGSVSTHRLSESKTVREQLEVFTLGEIWTAEGDEALAQAASSEGMQP